MGKISDFIWDVLGSVGEEKTAKRSGSERRLQRHTRVIERTGFESTISWKGMSTRYINERVTDTRESEITRGGSYGDPVERESRGTRFGDAVIGGALRIAHAFSRDEATPKQEAQDFFPRIPYQPSQPTVKPKTHSEIEKSLDVLFSSGADRESEDSSLPPHRSQNSSKADFGLVAGRPNFRMNSDKRGFSLPSFFRANTHTSKDRELGLSSSSYTPNVRVDREPQ